MKENFVIREERHPVGIIFLIILGGITSGTLFGGVFWLITGFIFRETAVVHNGVMALCVAAVCFGATKLLETLFKEEYYAAFDVEGLSVSYHWETGKNVNVKINDEYIECIADKLPPGETRPGSNAKYGIFLKKKVFGNHSLKIVHAGAYRRPDCDIFLDDEIIVEHGVVYSDKIRTILSGSVVSEKPAPRAVDTGVMPPFQTMPSHNSAEKTVAPRTKCYAIVGETGKFANHQFNVSDMLVLGRDAAECSVAFPADTAGVSRVHCKLVVEADGLCVYDLGSTYGTVVNNNKTISANQMMKLKHGDTITIGSNQTFVVKSM